MGTGNLKARDSSKGGSVAGLWLAEAAWKILVVLGFLVFQEKPGIQILIECLQFLNFVNYFK